MNIGTVNDYGQRFDYTSSAAFQSEAGRVGLVTCTRCGAAIFLSMIEDSLKIHDEWHAAKELP